MPDGSAVVHARSTSARGLVTVRRYSSPGATISNKRGSAWARSYSSSELEVLITMLRDLMKADNAGVRISPGE